MLKNQTGKNYKATLIAKALKNSSFKQKLMSNPKSTIAKTGITIPEDIEIEVIEEPSHTFYLVIPPHSTESEELFEIDTMESLAGGIYEGLVAVANLFSS